VAPCGSRLEDLEIGRASLRFVGSVGTVTAVDFDSQLTDRMATLVPVRLRKPLLLEVRGGANMTIIELKLIK